MKLSDFLTHAGRLVGYYPLIAKAVGGAKAGILLCQLFYNFQSIEQKETHKDLEELEGETGLTTAELRGARQTLKENGVLTERLAKLEHRIYFSLNFARIDELLEAYLARCEINNCPPQAHVKLTTGQIANSHLVLSLKEDLKKKEEKNTHPSDKIIKVKDKNYPWPSPEALIALYNSEAADELPAVSVISPGRIKKAKEYLSKFPTLEFWKEVFEETKLSPFLRGLKNGGQGHEHFKASFDWLLTKGKDGTENCVKTLEGRYREEK